MCATESMVHGMKSVPEIYMRFPVVMVLMLMLMPMESMLKKCGGESER